MLSVITEYKLTCYIKYWMVKIIKGVGGGGVFWTCTMHMRAYTSHIFHVNDTDFNYWIDTYTQTILDKSTVFQENNTCIMYNHWNFILTDEGRGKAPDPDTNTTNQNNFSPNDLLKNKFTD